ncbi:MAG TPA: DUF748 domain-containing protein [Verrucomicrobiae bacterium]|nr:DUF748 domain-containing protein [Verrucomicrobiae bacterium]
MRNEVLAVKLGGKNGGVHSFHWIDWRADSGIFADALMKMNYWRKLPRRRRKLALWILGVLLFYTVVGFLILPPIIRAVAVKELSEDLNRKVTIQAVRLNPFVPSLTVRGLLVEDKDGEPFLSCDEAYFTFQVSSIFRKAWTFRQIRVTGPYARAQMNKDYTYNFSDLVAKYSAPTTNAASKEPSKPLLVCIKHLNVTDARLSLADFTVRTPFKRVIGPVFLTASNVTTVADSGGSGTLFGRTDVGEYFSWRGTFCMTPPRSDGNVAIFDVPMDKFKALYQDFARFDIRSGQAGFCTDYRFEWSPSRHVAAVTNAAFGMSHFRLGLADSTNDIINLAHFAETRVSGDLPGRHGEIGFMRFSDADLFLKRGTNKTVNLLEMAKPKVSKPTAPGGILVLLNSITNAVAALVNTTNQWTGVIHEIDFTNCQGHLRDLAYGRPATLDLGHINVDVKNISNIPNTNLTANVSSDWNQNGKVNVGVTALISPPTVDIRLSLAQLDLSTLAPYAESQFNLFLPSADLGMEGHLHLHTTRHQLPEVTFRGDTWLDHFHAIDGIRGEDLLTWDEVKVSGIHANLNPPSASIREISANNVSARVIVETNGIINLIAAMHPPGATNTPAQTNAPAVAKTSASTTNAIPPVSITMVAITNAEFNFTDRSVDPHVHMDLKNAGGSITGISSTELQHGNVQLQAFVDGVSPAKITGRINPFSGTLTNQVDIFMTNMDMLPASPYAGKFAGYRIAQGALSVDLRYIVAGRKLDSENIITLNQFNFGDRVDSPAATRLPVRLAIAILKDRQGKIVLNVPIQGSLDDPKFRIGRVVEHTIVNILTRVATSPFSLLSSVFGGNGGGGAELRYEDFPPASADLTDATRKKLDIITKALYNRPGLQLQISGSVDPVMDREGLQQIAFERQLRTLEWHSLRRSQRQLITPDQVVIEPKDRTRLVTKLYDKAIADRRITPAIIRANTNLTAIAAKIQTREAKGWKQAQLLTKSTGPEPAASTPPSPSSKSQQQQIKVPTDPKEDLLTAIIPIPETELETLALRRARAVRSYVLSTGQVEVNRLFLTQSSGGLRQDGSRVYLELE